MKKGGRPLANFPSPPPAIHVDYCVKPPRFRLPPSAFSVHPSGLPAVCRLLASTGHWPLATTLSRFKHKPFRCGGVSLVMRYPQKIVILLIGMFLGIVPQGVRGDDESAA